jgi:hypothetical protein
LVRIALALALFVVGCNAQGSGGGEACTADHECMRGYCNQRVCTSGFDGAACRADDECAWRTCVAGACRKPGSGVLGTACEANRHCIAGLVCGEGQCVTPDEVERALAVQRQREERAEERAKEARLLVESGITEAPQAEKPVHSPGPGARVRVVSTTAKASAFAACRADERLIGGGCSVAGASYPSAHGEEDTVGARWNCKPQLSSGVTAYALCSKL